VDQRIDKKSVPSAAIQNMGNEQVVNQRNRIGSGMASKEVNKLIATISVMFDSMSLTFSGAFKMMKTSCRRRCRFWLVVSQ
jgi:signal recognition particle GTPase